ncbi:hypothetical protein STEG23_004749, partial [Scotinomys teguina]
MTVTPLGQDQDCSLKNREPDVPAPWFLDPGGWSKTTAVSLYFIFPGICTLSLVFCLNECLCNTCMPGVYGSQKRALYPFTGVLDEFIEHEGSLVENISQDHLELEAR